MAEARRVLDEVESVDVAVVDIGLPDGYGGDLIGDLREANPQARALVLSASLDRAEIGRAVEAGAAKQPTRGLENMPQSTPYRCLLT